MEEKLIAQMNIEYYAFLDDLRKSGVTNMFGATPYLVENFNLDESEARKILVAWMAQYKEKK